MGFGCGKDFSAVFKMVTGEGNTKGFSILTCVQKEAENPSGNGGSRRLVEFRFDGL